MDAQPNQTNKTTNKTTHTKLFALNLNIKKDKICKIEAQNDNPESRKAFKPSISVGTYTQPMSNTSYLNSEYSVHLNKPAALFTEKRKINK